MEDKNLKICLVCEEVYRETFSVHLQLTFSNTPFNPRVKTIKKLVRCLTFWTFSSACRDLFMPTARNSYALRRLPQFFILISRSVKRGFRKNRYSENGNECRLETGTDKSLCHFPRMLTQSLCFLFYFIWVFAYLRKKNGKKILQHFHAVRLPCQRRGKCGKEERKTRENFHLSHIQHPTDYMAHTSWKDFLSSDLIDVEKFSSSRFLFFFTSGLVCGISACVPLNLPPKLSTFRTEYWFDNIKIWWKIIVVFPSISLSSTRCRYSHSHRRRKNEVKVFLYYEK